VTSSTEAVDQPKTERRRPGLRDVWPLLKEAAKEWDDDNASRLAAALAYYTLLSIAPLIVLSVALAGMAYGQEAARGEIVREIGSIVGVEAARAIETIIAHAEAPAAGIWSTLIGAVVLLLGASGVFNELASALNSIFDVSLKPGQGALGFLRHRFLAFAMVLTVALLLFLSLILSAVLSAVGHFFASYLPGGELVWQLANFAIGLAFGTALFGLIFKVVPDVEVAWRDLWVGALVTATLFSLGKLLLGLYIGKSAPASSYGAAGSLVALVIWVYYSSQVFFFGAEFTQVYARRFGNAIRPNARAVDVNAPAPAAAAGHTSAA
jgi:membrane protein